MSLHTGGREGGGGRKMQTGNKLIEGQTNADGRGDDEKRERGSLMS